MALCYRQWFGQFRAEQEQFRQEWLAAASERVGLSHYGLERQETDTQKAERLVKDELQCLSWAEEQLQALPKGDQRKVAIARRLRQETTMSLKWIAQRLHMGSWTYVSNLLHGPPAPASAPPLITQQQLVLCQ